MAPPKSKNVKKVNKSPKVDKRTKPIKTEGSSLIPLELQQLLLNIFKSSFSERLESNIQPLLQEVKGHLYNRDFLNAFGRNDYLEAYAARWSPSRSLGYIQVLADLKEHISSSLSPPSDGQGLHGKIVCLGGGAGAEIVALGGLLNHLQRSETVVEKQIKLDVVAVDIADWSLVVEGLVRNATIAPTLSKYASAAARTVNTPLVKLENFSVEFHQRDILNTDFATLRPLIEEVTLVTIMFTLNELYSTSLSLTQKFLLNLTSCLQEGALLLVVDSPSSYSTISLNGAEKKYPMQWLLDHTLLEQANKGEVAAWQKVEEDDSRWFRLQPELKYPIELENMRFQLHLYKRLT